MVYSEQRGKKWERTKWAIAVVAVLLFFVQIGSAIQMMSAMDNKYKLINNYYIGSVEVGTDFYGELTEVCDAFSIKNDMKINQGDPTWYLTVDKDHRAVLITSKFATPVDKSIQALIDGNSDNVAYKGVLKPMTPEQKDRVMKALKKGSIREALKIGGDTEEFVCDRVIDAYNWEMPYSTGMVVATFIGAGLMLVVVFLCMRKTVADMIFAYKERHGVVTYDLKYTKDNIVREDMSDYSGNEKNKDKFYVDTDFDRTNYEKDDDPLGLKTDTTDFNKMDKYVNKILRKHLEEIPYYDTKEKPEKTFNDPNLFYSGGADDDGNFYMNNEEPDMQQRNSDRY